jgi:hypothetical protein
VKTKKLITILVFLVSMSGFSQAHNHEHDANGNHEDHTESAAHNRVAPTEKQWTRYL